MKAVHLFLFSLVVSITGCRHPKITAYDLNKPDHPEVGLPYYLPKYYLVVSKNVRYIPMPTIGLTETAPIPNSFDGGAAPANGGSEGSKAANGDKKEDKKEGGNDSGESGSGEKKNKPTAATANEKEPSSSPATPPGTQLVYAGTPGVVPAIPTSDGLIPETFYTYQFLALPDLTQKYGLAVKGGAGELRATLNLVNGWMFTGPGPLYMRDSFSSQNIAAAGTAAQQITDSFAKIASMAMGVPPLPTGGKSGGSNVVTGASTTTFPSQLTNFATIAIWEIGLENSKMTFKQIDLGTNWAMSREILALAPMNRGGGSEDHAEQVSKVEPAKELPALLVNDLKKAGWVIAADKIQVKAANKKIDVKAKLSDATTKPVGKTADDLKSAIITSVGKYTAVNTEWSTGEITVE